MMKTWINTVKAKLNEFMPLLTLVLCSFGFTYGITYDSYTVFGLALLVWTLHWTNK